MESIGIILNFILPNHCPFPIRNQSIEYGKPIEREVVIMGYQGNGGYGAGFALIVVLFILLIIVGAAYVGGGY